VAFSGCGNGNTTTKDVLDAATASGDERITVSQAQFDQNGMQMGSLQEITFPLTIHANGMIDVPPENRAVVSAFMGGYIKTTPLLIGDYVKKGQSLVTIENPEFVTLQQDYMQVKNQLNYLQSEYERQKTMVAENITSQKNFLKSESDFKTATAKFNGLRKQLTMLNIAPSDVENGTITSLISLYAPISGSITKIYVNKGTYVSPASPILEIVDNDHIHLELSVFEKDILKLKKEQKILFKIPEASSETFEGEVHLIGTSIDENRTIKVHGHPTNDKNHNFLTGMFVDASIIIDTVSAKALPSEAIVTIDDISYALLLDSEDGKNRYFKQVILQIGNTSDGYTLIKNPDEFKPSDRFLIKGAFNLMGE
jgi:cobalt-zinc-cadmium efflux system membrane fusion protein